MPNCVRLITLALRDGLRQWVLAEALQRNGTKCLVEIHQLLQNQPEFAGLMVGMKPAALPPITIQGRLPNIESKDRLQTLRKRYIEEEKVRLYIDVSNTNK
jgi:hypothetical protein